MQQWYGIDLSAKGLLERRSGHWLATRILGLLSCRSRLREAVFGEKDG